MARHAAVRPRHGVYRRRVIMAIVAMLAVVVLSLGFPFATAALDVGADLYDVPVSADDADMADSTGEQIDDAAADADAGGAADGDSAEIPEAVGELQEVDSRPSVPYVRWGRADAGNLPDAADSQGLGGSEWELHVITNGEWSAVPTETILLGTVVDSTSKAQTEEQIELAREKNSTVLVDYDPTPGVLAVTGLRTDGKFHMLRETKPPAGYKPCTLNARFKVASDGKLSWMYSYGVDQPHFVSGDSGNNQSEKDMSEIAWYSGAVDPDYQAPDPAPEPEPQPPVTPDPEPEEPDQPATPMPDPEPQPQYGTWTAAVATVDWKYTGQQVPGTAWSIQMWGVNPENNRTQYYTIQQYICDKVGDGYQCPPGLNQNAERAFWDTDERAGYFAVNLSALAPGKYRLLERERKNADAQPITMSGYFFYFSVGDGGLGEFGLQIAGGEKNVDIDGQGNVLRGTAAKDTDGDGYLDLIKRHRAKAVSVEVVERQSTAARDSKTYLGGSEWNLQMVQRNWSENVPKIEGEWIVVDCVDEPQGRTCAQIAAENPTAWNLDSDGAAGRIALANLPWGEYTLDERTAPAGYNATNYTTTFTVGGNSAVEPNPLPFTVAYDSGIVLPSTGGNGMRDAALGMGVVGLAFVCIAGIMARGTRGNACAC